MSTISTINAISDPEGRAQRLSRAITSDARASLTRQRFHMAAHHETYPAGTAILAGLAALFALVFPFVLEAQGALSSIIVTGEPREVSTGLEGWTWVFWVAAAIGAAVAAARLPRPQGRLEAVPGFMWKARFAEGDAGLALVPETGTGTPMVDVVVPASSAAQEVSVELRQDRTVVLTHPASDRRDWTETVVRAVNELRTCTGDFTRLPSTLPTVGARDEEALDVTLLEGGGSADSAGRALVNGHTLDMAEEPGERRVIGTVSAAWLARRLQIEAAAANRPAREFAAARSELDQSTLQRLTRGSNHPGGSTEA